VHRHDGLAILELEPAAFSGADSDAPLRVALGDLQDADSVAALCDVVVQVVRRFTGFERVMMYRFDEDDHGTVLAESKEDALEPYLGLHYPASDIPRQARDLYVRNWLRMIPDAWYVPSPIVPATRADTGQPIDLSLAVLRSVSQVHLEYLANMGVRASMSISLVVRGRLWGLVSCANHTAPRFVEYGVRSACETIGRLVSLQIAALDDREAAARRDARAGLLEALGDAMAHARMDQNVLEPLVSRPDALLALVGAEGAAVAGDGPTRTCGRTPPEDAIDVMVAWLDDRGERAPFATDALATAFDGAMRAKDEACGLLTIALPGVPRRRVLWFRPEIVHTVFWGGDPNKPAEPSGASSRLHPRRSFEKWKEEVRLRARPWTPSVLEAAEALQRRAVEIDLERQLVRAHRAVRVRDDVVAVVSHDLKNPLQIVQMQTALLRRSIVDQDEGTRLLRAASERIQRAVDRMNAMITDLLDLAKIEAGRFELQRRPEEIREVIDEAIAMIRPLAEAKRIAIETATDSCSAQLDRERMFQVLSNILGNAVKFTPEAGRITVTTKRIAGELWITIADSGPGIPEDAREQVFDRYWQVPRAKRRTGSGLGLFIAKGIVEAHGGRIWVDRAPSGGASFTVALATEQCPQR